MPAGAARDTLARIVAVRASRLGTGHNGHVSDEQTLYEVVGGMPFFRRLVDAFYVRVETDPILRPMYPPDELEGARERLTLFLGQYWGGPDTYSQRRGHPMLRRRHMPFPIDEAARNQWVTHMGAAVDQLAPPEAVARALRDYFQMAADAMVNQPD